MCNNIRLHNPPPTEHSNPFVRSALDGSTGRLLHFEYYSSIAQVVSPLDYLEYTLGTVLPFPSASVLCV